MLTRSDLRASRNAYVIEALRRQRYEKLAIVACEKLHSAGGFTLRTDNGDSAPNSGYAVSIFGAEKRLPIAELSPAVVSEYFANRYSAGEYFGGWVDSGEVYLDISVIAPSYETALAIAAENKQAAIYDLSNGKSISVSGAAHSGHFSDSGVQSHSAGPIFPLHIVLVGSWGTGEFSYYADGLGEKFPRYSFQWEDVTARRQAYDLAYRSAAEYLAQRR